MVRRHVSTNDQEPEQKSFILPSEKEHLFQIIDVIEDIDPSPDIIHVKLEVVGGDEEGRTLLNRLSLDSEWKGFFATRLFLKSIAEPYKGEIEIDTEEWIGKQMYATVKHSVDGKYANITEYNFEKMVEQFDTKPDKTKRVDQKIAWDE